MSNRKKHVILFSTAVLLSFMVASPTIYAISWHLRHGNVISFRGAEVRVPFGWIAEEGEVRSLNFIKFPALIVGLNHTTSGFELGKLPDTASRDQEEIYKSWVTMNWASWNPIGGVVQGPLTFGTGEKEVVCMTTFSGPAGSGGMASCLLFHRTWMAQFVGSKRDLDTFFGVARGATMNSRH